MSEDIFQAYLSGRAGPIYGGNFANADDRRQAVFRAVRPLAKEVADALEAQQSKFSASATRTAHMTALRHGAAAVVTGQQDGLVLGPIYTVYKAATAVRVARALSDETGETVVPVFWLQTEDHDLDEIASCHVRAPDAPLTIGLPVPPQNRVSVAHCTLPQDVTERIAMLRDELGNLPYAEEHLSRLARYYRPGIGWAEGFAGVLAELFSHTGLILVDPRDPALAGVAAAVHRRALVDAASISQALVEQTRMLKAAGWKVPIHVRSGAPLCFFHPDGPEGPRYRLSPVAGGFAEVGGERIYSQDELLDVLNREPRQFSSSALLRPILQDVLLPTMAYVGGPAEISYFAQLPPLYAAYGLQMPLIVPRAKFRILEERTERLLSRLRLSVDDLADAEDKIIQKLPLQYAAHPSPKMLEHTLAEAYMAALRDALAEVPMDALGLRPAADKMREEIQKAALKFSEKYQKALAHQDRALIEDLRRLKVFLYPDNGPQERFYGIAYFAARYGDRAFIEQVLTSVVPFDPALKDIRL